MTPDVYIDTLLKKYRKAPSFPFIDWKENTVSFYALINLWDELFSTAAGKARESYRALGDATQDPDSYIYRVIHNDNGKKFSVTPQDSPEDGGIFYLITNPGEKANGSDDQYDLGYVGDLDRNRLIGVFNMLQRYVKTPIASDDDRKKMDRLFVANYGKRFGFPDHNPYNSPLFPITETTEDDDED